MTDALKTPLYDAHIAAGAKMVPFAGFVMPLEYSGIIAEHSAVRTKMGIFDLSHMGEFRVTGDGAAEALDALMTNDIRGLDVWQARYSPMCRDDGGIIDDLLVYRYPDHFMLVVNAANITKDWTWVEDHLPQGVTAENVSAETALLAVQGPLASSFLQRCTTCDLAAIGYYHFAAAEVAGVSVTISRTGYTGEDGLELYVDASDALDLWDALTKEGAGQGLVPIGLGARDTLRLEAGLALYGNDIDDSTSPLEAGLGWTVKLEGRTFAGSASLARQKENGVTRRLVAFAMLDRGIPRPHSAVIIAGQPRGEVTSGTFSPTLRKGIGFAYVPREASSPGTAIEIDIRGTMHAAEVMRRPLYQRSG